MLKTLPHLIEKSVLALHAEAAEPVVNAVKFKDEVALNFRARFRTDTGRAKGKDAQLQHIDSFGKAKARALLDLLMGNWTRWHGQDYRRDLEDLVRCELKRHQESEENTSASFRIFPERPGEKEDPLTLNNEQIEISLGVKMTADQWKSVKEAWSQKGFLRKNKIKLSEVRL